jgi:Rrf2 family protein
MKIGTKGFYAVEVLRTIAGRKGIISISEIEKETGVSYNYAEKLLLKLKRAGLVKSSRGIQGGYSLAEKPSRISCADIFRGVGEDIAPWPCKLPRNRRRPTVCPMHPVWRMWHKQAISFFENKSLADFI